MTEPLIQLVVSLLVAGGVVVAVWAGTEFWNPALDWMEGDLGDKLRRLRRNPKNLRQYIIGWLFVGLLFVLGLWILYDMAVIGVCVAALWVSVPWWYLRRLAEQRRILIEDQLADAMVSLSSAIRAGLSLAQALDIIAKQSPAPISEEFSQIVGEYQMGKPLERALVEAKERLRSENFALFAAAMEASRQSGGRLNETVDRIAHSVRELQRLERKVESETAQARASAFYMAIAPVFILAIYYWVVDPQNTERLFQTFWGQVILSIALILNVVAYLWSRHILNPDI